MTIAPKLRYRTQANVDRVNALRATGLLWSEIAEQIGIKESTLNGWRKLGLKPNDEWPIDETLCDQLGPIWSRFGHSMNAIKFDERAAKITGRSADECRRHRLYMGLTRADTGGSDYCEAEWQRAAVMSDRLMRAAMERFYANRLSRMAAE
jgi:hypothetical protein